MSLATTIWRKGWRSVETRRAVAYIEIAVQGGPTLNFATQTMTTPGRHWEPLLGRDGAVSCPGSYMQTDVAFATLAFSVDDRPCSAAGGDVVSSLLAAYDFVGAGVTLWLSVDGAPFDVDALPRFVGVVQTFQTQMGVVKFRAMQTRDWNRNIQPRLVTRKDNPAALEATVGSPIPIAVGNVLGTPMRPPIVNPYGDEYRIRELIAGGTRAAQAVVIDAGRGGPGATTTRAKVAVASHAIKQLGNATPNWGTSPFVEQGESLHSIDPVIPTDIFNTDPDGAGFFLPDGNAIVFAPIYPVDIETAALYADNPRAILDPTNEFTAARMDWSGSKRALYGRLPHMENFGAITSGIVYVIYRGSSTLSTLQMTIRNTKRGAGQSIGMPATAWAFGFANINVPSNSLVWPLNGWEFGDCRIDFDFTGAPGAGFADIIACGFAVQYVPKREVLSSQKVVQPMQIQRQAPSAPRDRKEKVTVTEERLVEQNITEVRSKFYANYKGKVDAAGLYTGTVGAVIERPSDVARWLLEASGGVNPASIEVGVGGFGSFVDARALLKTELNTDFVIALGLSEAIDVNAVLAMVGDSCASQFLLSEFTGLWEMHPWRTAPATTYDMPISRRDLLDPETVVKVEMTPDTNVLSGLRVAYGWDSFTRSFLHETSISATGSVAGHYFRNLRDATCKVTASVNDKIDWTGGTTGAHTYTLGAGDHTPTQLLAALDAAFSAVTRSVAVGGIITAGVNDQLPITASAVNLLATLIPGEYSMEALAAHVQARLNLVSTGWVCTYSATTRKFTLGRGAGVSWTLRFGTGGAATCAAVLGYGLDNITGASGPTVAPFEAAAGHVAVSLTEEFDFKWKTGTNGLDGTKLSAWEVLGFDWIADQQGIGLGIKRHNGWTPKTDLEKKLVIADAKFGKRKEVTRDARGIYDTLTARALRNRLVTLMSKPRAVVSFASEVLADLRRADVFEFSSDMDEVKPYPVPGSGGSWAGRKFRVLETTQRFGGSWHTEVVAIDVTD